LWFPIDALPRGFDRERAKSSFMKGGFYTHDFPDSKISVIALNSMYFKSDNKCSLADADYQLDWLEGVLKLNAQKSIEEKREFILSMHVFPGLNYFKGWQEIFWRTNFTKRMEDILAFHQDSIKFISAAHIHRG
jgi:hypothetical protein